MDIYLFGQQLVFILGIVNVISLFLILSSCRCMGKFNFFHRLIKNKSFSRFYNWHCWFWWLFIFSVVAHAILAVIIFGIPF